MTRTRSTTRSPKLAPRIGRRARPRDAERIRWSRIMAAQARIASGYYDRPEVKDVVVDALWLEVHRH